MNQYLFLKLLKAPEIICDRLTAAGSGFSAGFESSGMRMCNRRVIDGGQEYKPVSANCLTYTQRFR